jgi:hypothetical protein
MDVCGVTTSGIDGSRTTADTDALIKHTEHGL